MTNASEIELSVSQHAFPPLAQARREVWRESEDGEAVKEKQTTLKREEKAGDFKAWVWFIGVWKRKMEIREREGERERERERLTFDVFDY